MTKLAMERAAAYRVHIEWALGQLGLMGRPISRRAAAKKLNERNIKSSTGRTWSGEQLLRMAHRIGLRPLPARLPLAVSQAKVREIWKRHPDYNAKQVMASGELPLPLCERTVRELLNNCRRSAANPQGRLTKRARLLVMTQAHTKLRKLH